MSAAEMAAESAVHGDSHASTASSGCASDARGPEPANGALAGAISPLQPPSGLSERPRRTRTANEQKLIARGRYLLHSYQQKKCEKQVDERGAGEVLATSVNPAIDNVKNQLIKHHKLQLANGHAAAAAASVGSEDNWLAKSVIDAGAVANSRVPNVQILQRTSEQILGTMEKRLDELWDVLQREAIYDEAIEPLRESLSTLLQGKRKVDDTIATATQHIAANVDITPGDLDEVSTADIGQSKSELDGELQEAKLLISELNEKVNAYRAQRLTAGTKQDGYGSLSDEVVKLQTQVQEKEELLISLRSSLEHVVQEHGRLDEELCKSRAAIERLEGEMEQMQKAASDKRTLLRRAYVVKAKQLDQLCKDVELPPFWERVTDENGIIYYRQNDRACAPELEDPRVPLILERLPVPPSGSSSPRSAGGRMEKTAHSARSNDRKYSSSSFDSTVSCEDIAVPPEDGMKHEVHDFETPLPEGWEMRVTTAGSVFFVNRTTNVTTWKDPRRMKLGGSTLTTRASAPLGSMQASKLSVDTPERRASLGDLTHSIASSSHVSGTEGGVRTFDVVFEEKGPIGIHFQANTLDSGAIVRRLLPRMAASRAQVIEPFDRLIAVNKNPVDSAPFRYVMLLLQGGLRPLTLTFERDPQRRKQHAAVTTQPAAHLDEEVIVDESEQESRIPANSDANEDSTLHHLRFSASNSYSSASEIGSSGEIREEYSVADKIITNLFSLFWTLPDQPRSQVETV